ncbi:Tat pathway signal protein [filamentous cyanobacterium CCP5]|nr:Tat pathway signal protein [filamentous cyanobacterium CCP5]
MSMSGRYSRRKFLVRGSATFGATLLLKACSTAEAPTEPVAEGTSETAPAASELTPIRFTLDWAVQGVHAPVGVAIEKGYFEAEGLDVTFERGSGSADAISKVASGAFDMGFGDINSLMEFNVTNPDTPVKAVAIYYNQSPMCVMSLADTGIDDPAKLEGKKLGIPAGSATRRLMPLFAQTVGFDLAKVEMPAIESKLQQTLLLTQEIDAIAPYTISALPNLKQEGYPPDKLHIHRFGDYGLNLYGNAVIVPAAFVDEHPEQVKGFLRALTKGLQDTLSSPDEAVEIMAQFDDLYEIPAERERLQIAIDTLFVSPEVEANGFGAVDESRFKQTIDQVVQGFELGTVPKPEDVFDGQYLPPLEERQLSVS